MNHRKRLKNYIDFLLDSAMVLFLVVSMGAWGAFIGFLSGYFIRAQDLQKAHDKGFSEAMELRVDFTNIRED